MKGRCPRTIAHVLVDLMVSAAEYPAMVIDFERVPLGIVLIEDELLEQARGAVLAIE